MGSRQAVEVRWRHCESAAETGVQLNEEVTRGCADASQGDDGDQCFDGGDAAPAVARGAGECEDGDEDEEIALDDAKRARIFTLCKLQIECPADKPETG